MKTSHCTYRSGSSTAIGSDARLRGARVGVPSQRLAILAVQQLTHRLSPSLAHFSRILALIGVHAVLSWDIWFGAAASRAAVGETGLIRLQLELFSADGADLGWESHLRYDTTLITL